MTRLVLYVLANVAGSFLCSLSEAALLSSSEGRIRARMEQGRRSARLLLEIKQRPERTLAAIVFLNNIFSIAGTGAIAAYATQVIHGAAGMTIFLAMQTFLIITFGEITPKVLGTAQPEAIAMRAAPVLVWLRILLAPGVWLVEQCARWARPRHRIRSGGEDEIRALARLGQEGGHIDPGEAELIQRIFRLDDITAEDVMTPRPLVQAFQESDTLAQIRDVLLATRHPQFPVYAADLDTVTGILYLRDALAALARDEDQTPVGALKRKALFLPTSKPVDESLKELQSHHGTMAIVIDEYGVTEGIITMDDLVEELVGEAIDEADVSAGLVKRISRTSALVHGLTRVRDVARFLHCSVALEDPEDENTTVNGLLQGRLERIPREGDEILLPGGLHLLVRVADERMAVRVLARSGVASLTPPSPAT